MGRMNGNSDATKIESSYCFRMGFVPKETRLTMGEDMLHFPLSFIKESKVATDSVCKSHLLEKDWLTLGCVPLKRFQLPPTN